MYSLKTQVLLLTAILSAIALVGCIFELSSGNPDWGTIPTWAILLTSIPVGVASFVTAVKLARQSLDS
jgi:multisubunit Na+/H+ antiporter MnhC subunit